MLTTEPSGPPVDDTPAAPAWHSDRVAFQDDRGEVTYSQARDQVYRMARALLARGLRCGQVVAHVMPITTQAVLVTHAIHHVGCGQMEVPTQLPADIQADLMGEAGAAAVVVDPVACGDELIRLLTGTFAPQLFSLGPAGIGEDLLALADRESPLPFESAARPDALSAFALTGGTTGRPKIVVRRYDSLSLRRLRLPGPLSRTERPVRLLKSNRLTGLARRFAEETLISGGTVLTRTDFEPAEVLSSIETQRVTHLFAPPHQLRALVDHPLLASTDTSSLCWVMSTTARASAGLLRRAIERLGPVVYNGYGQTEATMISVLSPEDYLPGRWERLTTCGRARQGVEIAVRDTAGHALPAGERGDLWVRTPYVMAGYLNRPDLTAQVLCDGWLRTGDVGFVDEDGFVTLLGRPIDAVNIGGRRIFFSEIENCVEEHQGVLDCAAFTVPGPGSTPILHVAVVGEAAVSSNEGRLRAAVLRQLGPAGVPQSVLSVPRIPLTYGNVPDRPLLAQMVVRPSPPSR